MIALYCLLFGVLYWIRLIGIYDGALWRFDLMPVHWRVTTVVLAAFFPFAGIGLWMMASWGPVIWFICAATEAVMYLGFPELFGQPLADRRLAWAGDPALCDVPRGDLHSKSSSALTLS